MIYTKNGEEADEQEGSPIKITPLAEDFQEDLYRLYSRYNPEYHQKDGYGEN